MNDSYLSFLAHAAPFATGTSPQIPWARIVLAFLFCIGLSFAAIAFIRARQGGSGTDWRGLRKLIGQPMQAETSEVTLLSRLRLSPTHQVCLISCKGGQYLVHVGPQSACVIDTFRGQEDSA